MRYISSNANLCVTSTRQDYGLVFVRPSSFQKGCVFVGRMRVFNAVAFNASRLEGRGVSDFVIKIKIGKPERKLRISYV